MVSSTSAKKQLWTTLEVPALRKKYYAESLGKAGGQKVAWCSNGVPSEILDAMDINAVYVENYATVCASKRLSSGFCRAGERAGFSQDVCGYARILMGYLLGGDDVPEAPYGGLAKPDFLVVNSYSCDSRVGWFATMSHTLNIPLYVIDSPYQPLGGCTEVANAVYTESQLEDFVHFLEQQTGTKLDRGKLREKVELARRANDIQVDIYDMRKAVPSPMGAGDAYTVVWPGMYMAGTKECDEFYERLRAEISERIEKKIGIVPEEKFRLLWSGLPLWYNMALLNYFEDFGGVVSIENLYFRYEKSLPSQHEDPLKDMAISSTLRRPYASDIEQRAQLTLEVIREYHVDGVILAYNPSCRMMYILQPELKNILDRHGIPNLSLECDMADERTYSEGQIKTRLDAFIERMLSRRGEGK
ncbi:MAG: 2-hydroxyacyl-CoA dehydratase family protein [Chloroflexota bacterium]|nr:2-hydroxyacyl-CoA dehydratase family protein [Chloroflexota bacterium]